MNIEKPIIWQTLKLTISKNLSDLLSDLLLDLGAHSISLTDAADQALFELQPHEQLLWDQVEILAYFDNTIDLASIKKILDETLAQENLHIETQTFHDENWVEKVKSHFKPQRFGKLMVYPSWEIPKKTDEIFIQVDPGQAFGTGSHATTSLCLNWLAHHDLTDKTLLDMGCGSGILGIAAHRLGCQEVACVDNDPLAIEITRENASMNNIFKAFAAFSAEETPQKKYDIVIANILSQTLISLADELANHVKSGGCLVLSGILQTQVDAIEKTFSKFFATQEIIQQDEWVLWWGIKK